jgi:hypothetical protein
LAIPFEDLDGYEVFRRRKAGESHELKAIVLRMLKKKREEKTDSAQQELRRATGKFKARQFPDASVTYPIVTTTSNSTGRNTAGSTAGSSQS